MATAHDIRSHPESSIFFEGVDHSGRSDLPEEMQRALNEHRWPIALAGLCGVKSGAVRQQLISVIKAMADAENA